MERLAADRGVFAALGAAALVAIVGVANGGYFPTTWGWIVVVLAWAACMALVLRERIAVTGLEVVMLGALVLFVGWVAASVAWSVDQGQSVAEVQRDLVYATGVLAGLLVVRRATVPHLLAGLLLGIGVVDVYALATRLSPSGLGDEPILLSQLARPVGYPNALGILSVVGVFLALGFAARSRDAWARAGAAAALPVLLTTLYFTFSRGAWMALFAAAAATLALDPRRIQLLTIGAALAPSSAAALWLSSRQAALTALSGPYDEIRAEGRSLAVILLCLAAASAASALVAAYAERRVAFGPVARRTYAVALVIVLVGGLAAASARYGDPRDVAGRAYDSFVEAPSATPEELRDNDLNRRLFTLTGTYRVEEWRAAWDAYRSSPSLGLGAGTFQHYWLQHRTINLSVRDAHTLYLEVLAELGWIGLVLLAVALAAPLLAAVRGRAVPLVPPAAGAYLAYALHAGVDWDWELPAVTLVGLLCGVAILVSTREARRRSFLLGPSVRAATVIALVAVAAFSMVGLIGNRQLTAATGAVNGARWHEAAREARAATRWLPWSGKAWQQLGNAQLGLGDEQAARASLRKAAQKSPRDWSIWFDLGTASRGAERRAAYNEAARLNPLHPNVRDLREER